MNFISEQREQEDTEYLLQQLALSDWWDSSVVLVTCSPEYSARLTQTLNHRLSHLNRNLLYEQATLPLPTKGGSQFWDECEGEYVSFDRFVHDWTRRNLHPGSKYLFVANTLFEGTALQKVRSLVKARLASDEFRFCCLYWGEKSPVIPDFFIRKFETPPIFHWENSNT